MLKEDIIMATRGPYLTCVDARQVQQRVLCLGVLGDVDGDGCHAHRNTARGHLHSTEGNCLIFYCKNLHLYNLNR